ncbi:MAG: polysaccharide biosynthesis C-terminal domain-containing protein [Hyphomonadaceae bacterium]|nr:polysaccharide biosynthesis C-terminal domain-containing protein [Hyphomonadaceae bacterium]
MKAARLLAVAPLQAAQALVGFGSIVVFTRLMSAEDFGRYALALSISMAAHTLLFTWAEAAAFRFFATAQAARRLADHFATLLGIAFLLGGATLLVTAFILSRAGLAHEASSIAAFAAGAASLRFVTRIARETDRASLSFTRYAVLETAYLALGFAAGVGLLIYFDLGAAAPFAGLMLAGVLIAMIDAPRLFAQASGGYVTLMRTQLYAQYGTPLALALVVDLGVQALARTLVATQAGEASLGAYAAAFGLTRPLDLIFTGVAATFAPMLFSAYEKEGAGAARGVAADAFAWLCALTLPACVGLAMVAEPLTTLMIGRALSAEAAAAMPWLAFAALCSGFALHYWSEAFQLTHRTGQRALLMLAPGAVQLMLTFALARTYGAQGAAIASAAGAALAACLLALRGRKLFDMPAPSGVLVRIAIATASMAGVLAMLPAGDGAGWFALRVGVGLVTYLAVASALNVLGARDRIVRAILRPAPATAGAEG